MYFHKYHNCKHFFHGYISEIESKNVPIKQVFFKMSQPRENLPPPLDHNMLPSLSKKVIFWSKRRACNLVMLNRENEYIGYRKAKYRI
jgi:hypothetical protein